ncbi:MAG: GNAT family N-acetyltransferase [Candidatus Margulisiibacteriota bacterium]
MSKLHYTDEMIMEKYRWHASRCGYSNEEIHGMRQLAEQNQGNSELTNEDYLRWLYLENPAGKAIIMLAKDNNKVIGQVVFLPIKIRFRGKEITGSCAMNVLTDVTHRNKGIFAVLARKAFVEMQKSNIKVAYGLPNNYAYPTWIKRTKFKDIGIIPDLIKILNPEKYVGQKIQNVFMSKIIGLLCRLIFISKRRKLIKQLYLREANRFDAAFDRLWENNSAFQVNGVVRRKEYLNWRYFSCPSREYKVFYCANTKDEVQAYIVLRTVADNNQLVGWIIDIYSSISDMGRVASEILVSHAIEYFKSHNVDLIRSVVSNKSPGYKALRRNGFWRTPRIFKPWPIKIIMSHLADERIEKDNLDHWYFTLGDNDAL